MERRKWRGSPKGNTGRDLENDLMNSAVSIFSCLGIWWAWIETDALEVNCAISRILPLLCHLSDGWVRVGRGGNQVYVLVFQPLLKSGGGERNGPREQDVLEQKQDIYCLPVNPECWRR